MSDSIDRAQAMTELQMNAKRLTLAYEAHGEGRVEYSDIIIRLSDALDVLRGLPSAQPERKTGRWNKYYRMHSGDTFVCDKCGGCFVVLQGSEHMDFCPNCGADMRGGK